MTSLCKFDFVTFTGDKMTSEAGVVAAAVAETERDNVDDGIGEDDDDSSEV